jgi:hypothetical protein
MSHIVTWFYVTICDAQLQVVRGRRGILLSCWERDMVRVRSMKGLGFDV